MSPLRGDLNIGDLIYLPKSTSKIGIYNKNINIQYDTLPKDKSIFSGVFEVTNINYLGDFRKKDGKQWISNVTCKPHFERTNKM